MLALPEQGRLCIRGRRNTGVGGSTTSAREGGGPLTHLAQHARQVERLATALSLWERIMRHPIHTAAQAAHPQRCVRSARPRGARGALQPATRRMGSPMRRLNIAAGAALGQPPL